MNINNVYSMYFSPAGSTEKTADTIARSIHASPESINIMNNAGVIKFTASDLIVIAMPVFSGRLPSVCIDKFTLLEGNGAAAVIAVVYGNREYDDALIELADIMAERGFRVVSAAAFIGRHSIFPSVGEGRPGAEDINKMKLFAEESVSKLSRDDFSIPAIKGNRPYTAIKGVPIKPKGSRACNKCGVCVKVCPTGAIHEASPRKTDKKKCIACTACVYACKQNARSFDSLIFRLAQKSFYKKYNTLKKPEIFL